jgi:hypothetical protein
MNKTIQMGCQAASLIGSRAGGHNREIKNNKILVTSFFLMYIFLIVLRMSDRSCLACGSSRREIGGFGFGFLHKITIIRVNDSKFDFLTSFSFLFRRKSLKTEKFKS